MGIGVFLVGGGAFVGVIRQWGGCSSVVCFVRVCVVICRLLNWKLWSAGDGRQGRICVETVGRIESWEAF